MVEGCAVLFDRRLLWSAPVVTKYVPDKSGLGPFTWVVVAATYAIVRNIRVFMSRVYGAASFVHFNEVPPKVLDIASKPVGFFLSDVLDIASI